MCMGSSMPSVGVHGSNHYTPVTVNMHVDHGESAIKICTEINQIVL